MARLPKPWYWGERGSWFVTIAGTRHNLGPDKKGAFTRFHALMREPKTAKVASQSLAAIIDAFLDWVQKNRAPRNYESYRYRLERFAKRYPELTPDELRPFHVEKWADAYAISRTTRRNYLRAVKRCLRWAVEQGYLDKNPIAQMRLPAADRREVSITQEQFDALLKYVRDSTLKDLLIAAWETGCRPQEILKVTAKHVDRTNSRWVFTQSEAKMKRQVRVIYLNARANEITGRLMAKHPEGALFRNSQGKPWTTFAVSCAFRRIRTRMGLEILKAQNTKLSESEIAERVKTLNPKRSYKGKVLEKTAAELREEARAKLWLQKATAVAPQYSLYVLRHSFATNALERGVDALTVAILMGHRDPSMLARVYQHLSHNPKHLLEQARRATGQSAIS